MIHYTLYISQTVFFICIITNITTADIIISERSNVLLVPSQAITQDSQDDPMVKVIVNEQIQERSVVIGISDAYQTEIVSGLQEGEIVVIEIRAKATSSGPGGFMFGG